MTSDPAVSPADWERLSTAAWDAREHARVHGPTSVGAAVLSTDGRVFAGCNIEHQFRSHDTHAEVAALSAMVTAGHARATAILIVADRERFTPCGSCLDWIFELGGPSTTVAFQPARDAELQAHLAADLMPHYPR